MMKSVFAFVLISLPFGAAAAQACPALTLKCSLVSQMTENNWKEISQASSTFYAAPLHCSARVSISSPIQPQLRFLAVSSASGDTFLFTSESGKLDYTFYAVGEATKAPVVLENKLNRFTCSLE